MRVLISDLGNVALLFDLRPVYEAFAGLGGYSPEEIQRRCRPLIRQAEAGKLSAHGFWRAICATADIQISYRHFAETCTNIWTPNEPYIDFLRSRKASGRKAYLLSNLNVMHWNYCRTTFRDVLDLFDRHFISCRMKMRKPDIRVFLKVLAHARVPASDCLFVDDLAKNTTAALRIGMHAWQYDARTHDAFLDYIRAMG